MFGTPLIGTSLVVNAAMRWPWMIPIAIVATVGTSVTEPTQDGQEEIAISVENAEYEAAQARLGRPSVLVHTLNASHDNASQVLGASAAASAPAPANPPVEASEDHQLAEPAETASPPPRRLAAHGVRRRAPIAAELPPVHAAAVEAAAEAAVEAVVPEVVQAEPASTTQVLSGPPQAYSATDSDSDYSPGVMQLATPR